jgi:hypothetical protein
VLKEEGFIYIGPNDAGNKASIHRRFGMALDAVHNMTREYRIDPERVIISGFSGGGRVASMLAILYPDVFTQGGIYVAGCNTWHEMKWSEGSKNYINYSFLRHGGKPKKIDVARKNRFVFHTGENDFNRINTTLTYEHYQDQDFEHLLLRDDPGKAHSVPETDSFRIGIQFMNEEVPLLGQQRFAKARTLIQNRNFVEAVPLLQLAQEYGVVEATTWIEKMQASVDQQTQEASRQLEQGNLLEADQRLTHIRRNFGDRVSKEAKHIQETLQESPEFQNEKIASEIFGRIQRSHSRVGAQTTLTHLKRLINEYPGTQAAVDAQAGIERVQGTP